MHVSRSVTLATYRVQLFPCYLLLAESIVAGRCFAHTYIAQCVICSGRLFNLQCVGRGEELLDFWVVQCNMCWAWRELPLEYQPHYINKLICERGADSENNCMSGEQYCRVLLILNYCMYIHTCHMSRLLIFRVAGFGKCHQRYTQVRIQRNNGTLENPHWQDLYISASSCCDCKVLPGSPLHSFIAG